jgi:hypothetical protein
MSMIKRYWVSLIVARMAKTQPKPHDKMMVTDAKPKRGKSPGKPKAVDKRESWRDDLCFHAMDAPSITGH